MKGLELHSNSNGQPDWLKKKKMWKINKNISSSVQFSSSTDWVVRGTWGMIQQRSSSRLFCRRPLWAVLAWAGMFTLWCCPAIISSASHSNAHLLRCPEGWFGRGCHGSWHARTMQVSVCWHLPEEVPVDQGSWSCSAPSHRSCAPSRRCQKVSLGTWFQKLGSFFFPVFFVFTLKNTFARHDYGTCLKLHNCISFSNRQFQEFCSEVHITYIIFIPQNHPLIC